MDQTLLNGRLALPRRQSTEKLEKKIADIHREIREIMAEGEKARKLEEDGLKQTDSRSEGSS